MFFARIADFHRRTRKPKDIVWNRFVARPLASTLLVVLHPTRVTPNQVTLASLAVFVVAAAVMVAALPPAGLVAAVIIVELSYVLDCADGQLARWRGTSTPVGAHLDFFVDELKAFLLVAAVAVRLWRTSGLQAWLVEGIAGLLAVACAISLTTFIRRPEYTATTGGKPSSAAGDYGDGFAAPDPTAVDFAPSLPARARRALLSLGQLAAHYPTTLPFFTAAAMVAGQNECVAWFLHVYIGVHALYAARTLLCVARNLGRAG